MKKLVSMLLAAVMVLSIGCVGAFSEESGDIETICIDRESTTLPIEITATLESTNHIKTTDMPLDYATTTVISLPTDDFEELTVEVSPVNSNVFTYNGVVTSNTIVLDFIELYEGYDIKVIGTNGNELTYYTTDFSIYPVLVGRTEEISDDLAVGANSVSVTVGNESTEIGLIEDSIYKARQKELEEIASSSTITPFATINKGTLPDGTSKKAAITSNSDVHKWSYTNDRVYVNFYLGMSSIKSSATYGLTVLNSSGSVIYGQGLPFTANGGSYGQATNAYFSAGTKFTIEIDEKYGTYDDNALYELRAKSYSAKYE